MFVDASAHDNETRSLHKWDKFIPTQSYYSLREYIPLPEQHMPEPKHPERKLSIYLQLCVKEGRSVGKASRLITPSDWLPNWVMSPRRPLPSRPSPTSRKSFKEGSYLFGKYDDSLVGEFWRSLRKACIAGLRCLGGLGGFKGNILKSLDKLHLDGTYIIFFQGLWDI